MKCDDKTVRNVSQRLKISHEEALAWAMNALIARYVKGLNVVYLSHDLAEGWYVFDGKNKYESVPKYLTVEDIREGRFPEGG